MPISAGAKTQQALRATPTRKYGVFTRTGGTHPVGSITQTQVGATPGQRHAGSFLNKGADLALTGLVSAEAFGGLLVGLGTLTVVASSIGSDEAFGTLTITAETATIAPTGIESSELVGAPGLLIQGVIAPTMIDDGQQLVSWTANTDPDLAGYRLYVTRTSGDYTSIACTKYDVGLTLTPSTPAYVVGNLAGGETYFFAVASYDTSDNESAKSSAVSIVAAASIRFGAITLDQEKILLPPSIASVETIGAHQLALGQINILPSGLASDGAFGSNIVVSDTASLFLNLVAVASAEAFGTSTVVGGEVIITCTGLSSEEAVGETSLVFEVQVITAPSLASAEAVGSPLVTLGLDKLILMIEIASEEAFGISLPGIVDPTTGEVLEEPTGLQIGYALLLPPINSTEEFGTPTLVHLIEPLGAVTAEAFGTPSMAGEATTIVLTSLPSAEQMGSLLLLLEGEQVPVKVFEALERQFVFKATSPR